MDGLIVVLVAWLGAFMNADWRGALRKHGPAGLVLEFVASMTRLDVWPFFVPARYRPAQIRRILAQAAARRYQRPPRTWGFYRFGNELIFYAPVRQAVWVADILERNRIPLLHRSRIVRKRK